MKKFYKIAETVAVPEGYAVLLDGKTLNTPMKKPLLLSSMSLAEAVAYEWMSQEGDLNPASMPFTRLANTMIDKSGGEDRAEMNARLLEYGGSDLVCYFAEHPADLVKRQHLHWMPLIAWMQEEYGIVFETVSGIRHRRQPQESLDKLASLMASLGMEEFTVVQAASAVTGSIVISFAFLAGRVSTEEAWQAACVDEIFQMEKWGEDAEACKRLDVIRLELDLVYQFRNLVKE